MSGAKICRRIWLPASEAGFDERHVAQYDLRIGEGLNDFGLEEQSSKLLQVFLLRKNFLS